MLAYICQVPQATVAGLADSEQERPVWSRPVSSMADRESAMSDKLRLK